MTPLRLAMWSGPRNISTAMLRSFGSRSDTFVTDEPLYASYLSETGLRHPRTDEILASQANDWREVAEWLSGPVPEGRSVWYQKHMTHHLLPDTGREWMKNEGFVHTLLVREPRAMLTSLIDRLGDVDIEATGIPQQVELCDWLTAEFGEPPVVLDSREVQLDPRAVLMEFCERVGIPFEEAMLSWEPGPRSTDGVWGPHWYRNTLASTEFTPYKPKDVPVPDAYESMAQELDQLYARLSEHAIRAPRS